MQCIVSAVQRNDDACQIPAGIELPVGCLQELDELNSKLEDAEIADKLVNEF